MTTTWQATSEFLRQHRVVTRRQFVKAGLAAFLPSCAFAGLDSNPDVVIVGAGVAGIAAAHVLLGDRRKVAIVEARSRVGGRVHTDTTTFNAPYDTGAHWLHNGRRNPYHFLARNFGFDVEPVPETYRLFTEDREASHDKVEKVFEIYGQLERAIGVRADQGHDIPVSTATEHIAGRWSDTAKFVLGPWDMGKDLTDFSTADWWESEGGGEDFVCRQGYGAVVERYARDLKISLNTEVKGIDWSGSDIVVETTNGKLRTKAVIVTTSTGVLASGSIRFTPQLPLGKQESFHAISMGLYDHIALQFSEDVFGMGRDGYLLFEIGSDGRGFGTLTNASDTGIAYCDVGGDWARQLASRSIDEKVDYALGELERMLGSSVRRNFSRGTATAWGNDIWSLGSYASARPGAYAMRQVLRQPVADRIFFAGEACHRTFWATVDGAHLSGRETATAVSRMFG
ncbi:MAG: NAD(P)/FAD-dependent oxidoreductase [Acidiferrobacterales bacterium]|nr:NAD(P)/FAD-dependent oxidoreductase [Acidiferrobacterales bacterium]